MLSTKHKNTNIMEVSSRIKERMVNGMLMAIFYLITGISACFAQMPLHATSGGKTEIRLAANVNPDATPEAINLSINSAYHELKPALTPCGRRLYFSRIEHPSNTNGVADPEDIWYTEYNEEADSWSEPIRMTGVLNNAGPNYVNSISITGDTLVLGNQYGRNGKMKAGLSYSVKLKGQWTQPQPIQIEDDYNISAHANQYVSLKTGVIISSVQRADTHGERDLYVSFWNGKSASAPLNMGNIINTPFEESSPFLSQDTKSLYFASKGHNGFGGYDIYVTRRLDDSWVNWSEPENLGPAVNGALDDEFFSITHCGQYAVFSKQVNVHNVDLYKLPMNDLFLTPARHKRSQGELKSLIASL